MAVRPYFRLGNAQDSFFEQEDGEFKFSPGFAPSQKKKNVHALHDVIRSKFKQAKILEISTKSDDALGVNLSAFNLTWEVDGRSYPVECIFQGCKVFQNGGPFKDIILKKPLDAKRDIRLKESGELTGFKFRKEWWPLSPKSCFYDFIYIQALKSHPELMDEILAYDTFTDIEFNPNKSINCQARSVAIFVTLSKFNLLDEYLSSQANFLRLYDKRIVDSQGELSIA